MKRFILSMLISIISLLTLSFFASLIFSIIQYNNSISINNYIVSIVSIIIFFVSGFIFGLINKKQGLIGSFAFILVYLIFVLIFDVFAKLHQVTPYYFIFIIIKALTYSIGSILAVNIKTK